MRAYFWGNMYMSSIQQGIQSLHCLNEMYCKYNSMRGGMCETKANADLFEWGREHKTVIILGGGESADLIAIWDQFDVKENKFPWAVWSESVSALNSAATCVGIIVSSELVDAVAEMRASKRERRRIQFSRRLNDFEFDLVKLIFYSHMAR